MRPSPDLNRLHFIGIGGAGMSSLAEVMVGFGFTVSGSDAKESAALAGLRRLGVMAFAGHAAHQIGDAQAVIYSAAIPMTNPEMVSARERGLPLVRRADWLGRLTAAHRSLLVAGTHGKSTTTAMLGSIYLHAGRYPTLVGGAAPRGQDLSAVAGRGGVLIAEADEFDRAFLSFSPTIAIVTNVDADHLDIYGTEEALHAAFQEFLQKLPARGLAVLHEGDRVLQGMRSQLSARSVTFGFESQADYRAMNRSTAPEGETFDLVVHGKPQGTLRIRVPGAHNVLNALAAAAVALEEGLTFDEVSAGLAVFSGVKRRLEYLGEKAGVLFYDDYGHHPTEVEASLTALRELAPGRVVLVFQPHLYSRTAQLAEAFAKAVAMADLAYVTRIYPAREKPLPGVEGDSITALVPQGRQGIHYLAQWEDAGRAIASELRAGDLFVTMGAGDIDSLNARVMEALT
jgi:UDP-N-acetylmuramate--alanine ligase